MKSIIFKKKLTPLQKSEFNIIIKDYTDNFSDYHKEIDEIITEAVYSRNEIDTQIYLPITKALQGNVGPPITGVDKIDLLSSEANQIMDSKAAAFDTSAIDLELKPIFKEKPIDESKHNTSSLVGLFNKYLNAYLSTPKFEFTFSDAIKDSRAYPISITLIGWDDNIIVGSDTENIKGDITCKAIPISDFWWDPAAAKIEDCEYVITLGIFSFRKLNKEMVKYPNFNSKLLEALYFTNPPGGSLINSTIPTFISKQFQVENGGIPLAQIFRKNYNEKEKKSTVTIDFVAYGKFVIASTTWNISMLPFAILKERSVGGKFLGISSVMLALGKIKELHLVDTVIAQSVLEQQGTTWLTLITAGVNRQAFLDNKINQNTTVQEVHTGDLQNTIVAVPNVPIDPSLLVVKNSILADIDRLSSATDLINGVTNSSITGAAVRNKEEQATIKENTSVIELKKYLVRFSSIVIEFMKNNWFKTADKGESSLWLRYPNSSKDRGSDKFTFFEFKKEDLKYIVADIDINCTLLRSSKKEKQIQDLMMLYQIGLQYKGTIEPVVTIEEIIDVLNIPNKDIILDRLKESSQETKLRRAVTLVNQVLAAQQNPEMQGVPVEQIVLAVLEQMNTQQLPTDSIDTPPAPEGVQYE